MVAGHQRERSGRYHIVLSYVDGNGNRHSTSKTTKLPIKGNKKRADEMLQNAIREKEEELRLQMTETVFFMGSPSFGFSGR